MRRCSSIRRFWHTFAPCLVLSACGGRLVELPAYPLYPNPERNLPGSEIAKLVGTTDAPMSTPILQSVDGWDVTAQDAPAFALLPGCHLVVTARKLMLSNGNLTIRGGLRPQTYAMTMKPGHVYVVRLMVRDSISGFRDVVFLAEEQDAAGKTTATFEPTRNIDEINACRRATPPQA